MKPLTVPVVVEVTLPDIKRVNLKPDDIIVYEVDAGITINDAQVEHIKERVESWFPGHQVVVVVNGQLRIFDKEEDGDNASILPG